MAVSHGPAEQATHLGYQLLTATGQLTDSDCFTDGGGQFFAGCFGLCERPPWQRAALSRGDCTQSPG